MMRSDDAYYYYHHYYGVKIIVSHSVHRPSMVYVSLQLGVQLIKCTPYQHLDCNITHDRYLPDALRSTKQIEIKYLAQGHKHAGRSGARTHNIDDQLVISFNIHPKFPCWSVGTDFT